MNVKLIITGLVALLGISTAQAQTAGSFVLSTGWFHLAPQDSSQALRETNVGGTPVNITVPGSGAGVSNANTVGLSGMYYITDHIATELVLGIAPKFKLNGGGTLASFGQIGEARQWSPTLLLKYYFLSAQSKFRPYLGLGVSRVWFTGTKITNPAFLQNVLQGPTTASADSSWAPVFNGGVSYQFDKHWSASFSVSYLPLRTTAHLDTTANTPVGPLHVQSQAYVKLNPIVTYLSVGYRF